jgi:lipoate-protein ligase A
VTWRLIVDPPASGAWNMAVDEALLATHAEARGVPTLRIYGWRPAAVSLGRSQDAGHLLNAPYLREENIDLVRRPTGGLAVLHEHERTYSVVAGLGDAPFSRSVRDNYLEIASALQRALGQLGVEARVQTEAGQAVTASRRRTVGPICFELTSAHEITVEGRKLVGSAQLRLRRSFLQHGSLLCRGDAARLAAALGQRRVPRGFVGLQSVLGRSPATDELDAALVHGFEQHFGMRFERARLAEAERERAVRLYAWKYLSVAWTQAARCGVSAAR